MRPPNFSEVAEDRAIIGAAIIDAHHVCFKVQIYCGIPKRGRLSPADNVWTLAPAISQRSLSEITTQCIAECRIWYRREAQSKKNNQ